MKRAAFCLLVFLLLNVNSFLFGNVFEDKWLYTQTKDFELISNISERKTRIIIEDLHEFKAAFESVFTDLKKYPDPRLAIIICKNKKTLASMCRQKEEAGKALANVVGFFGGDDEGGYAIINAKQATQRYSKSVLYHEYVHRLLSKTGESYPLWFHEGVAKAFQTFQVNPESAVFGHPDVYARYFLTDYANSFMPFEELFAVRHNSSAYYKHGASHHFYATSWVFTHFCIFGRNGKYREAFFQFVKADQRGDRSEETFKKLFGMSFAQMTAEMKDYLGGGRLGGGYYGGVNFSSGSFELKQERFSMIRIPRKELQKEYSHSLRRAKEVDVRRIVGEVLACSISKERRQRARDILIGARMDEPENVELIATMGLLEEQSGNGDKAIKLYEEAIAGDVRFPLAYVHLAELKWEKLRSVLPETLTTEEVMPLLKLLDRGRALGSTGRRMYRRLADIYLSSDLELNESHLSVLREGLRVYANDYRLALRVAELKYRSSLTEEANSLVSLYLKANIPEWAKESFRNLKDSSGKYNELCKQVDILREREKKIVADWERPSVLIFQ